MRSRVLVLAAVMMAMVLGSDNAYRTSIEQWRHERETKLKSGDGWLTVAGLFWLKNGMNTAGSAESNSIQLPHGPAHVGDFEFKDGKPFFRSDAAVTAEVNGTPAKSSALRSDSDPGGPDKVTVGDLTMYVIHRGDRYAIRLKDRNSSLRRDFTRLHWFPVREEYRIVARFVPYDQAHMIAIPNILGQTEKQPSSGYAIFTLHGHEYRLEPVLEENQLFFIFRDQTSGKETYGSGRFLYADLPKEGSVVLDFNKAENPPCAFTPYATCPLPPAQNRLATPIQAGELKYGQH